MKGLVFSETMVKAWLAGNKTVTRRLISNRLLEKYYAYDEWCNSVMPTDIPCSREYEKKYFMDRTPYRPGETVYIKETWNISSLNEMLPGEVGYPWHGNRELRVIFKADFPSPYPLHPKFGKARWRPSIHLSEKDARSHARIVSVRPERITEITRTEAIMEGVMAYSLKDYMEGGVRPEQTAADIYFKELWESLYPGSWERNDWVWRIELRKEANHA